MMDSAPSCAQFLPASINPDAGSPSRCTWMALSRACSVGLLDVKQVTAKDHEDEIKALPDFARSALVLGDTDSVIVKSTLMEVSAVLSAAIQTPYKSETLRATLCAISLTTEWKPARDPSVMRARRLIDEVETRMESFTLRQEAAADRIEAAAAVLTP